MIETQMIYSTDPNGVIGIYDGTDYDQPFKCKKDFTWFRSNTENKVVVMGYNTYTAMEKNQKVFEPDSTNRTWVVITSKPHLVVNPNVIAVTSVYNAIKIAENLEKTLIFIGGSTLFNQVESLVKHIIVTKYNEYANITGDTTGIYYSADTEHLTQIYEAEFVDGDLSGEFIIYSRGL